MFSDYRPKEMQELKEQIRFICEEEERELEKLKESYQNRRDKIIQKIQQIENEENEKLKNFFTKALCENEEIYHVKKYLRGYGPQRTIELFVFSSIHLMELFIEITEETVHFNAKFAGYDEELTKEFAEDKIFKFKKLVETLPEYRLPSLCSDFFTTRIRNVTLPNFDARKREIINYFKEGVPLKEIHKKMKLDEELVQIEIKQIIKGSFDPFYDIFSEFPKLI
jgi:hypothetical protein